ncbi:MAG: xanthine dehydrogenase family protein subunit M [Alphaproteobacteria bacterium]|nr:xanthine dehydrogenase family protein subunit M [Alphaproteobacteria bacterium]
MKAPRFSYVRAESLEQVFELLKQYGEDARILAGGQSLIPTLNMRLSQPAILIDINRLDMLKGISAGDGAVRIGALARHAEVAESPVIAARLPLIAAAMPHVAHVAVRNRGTFGGSVALADPAAEMPACVLALGGTLVVAGARGRREIAAEDFFRGLYETAREPDEILVEVRVPTEAPGTVSVFLELAQRHGDFAIAGLACHARIEGDTVADARLVYFASEDRPRLAKGAMAALAGKAWNDGTRAAVIGALTDDLDPMTNLDGGAAMKLHLQRVLTGRALDAAVAQARAA